MWDLPRSGIELCLLHWQADSLLILTIINAEEGVEKREPSYTVGMNLNRYSNYGGQYGNTFKKKTKIELSYDLAIPLMGIYPEKTIL